MRYSHSESVALIEEMTTNIVVAKETIVILRQWLNRFISNMENGSSDSAECIAGKEFFEGYIVPLTEKFGKIIDLISSNLEVYKRADRTLASLHVEVLDEDDLVQDIEISTKDKELVDEKIKIYRSRFGTYYALAGAYDSGVLRMMEERSDGFGKNIAESKRWLRVLRRFDADTKGLFSTPLAMLSRVMEGVKAVGSAIIDPSTGSFSFSPDVNPTLLEELHGENETDR
jgi:hypothetical protein